MNAIQTDENSFLNFNFRWYLKKLANDSHQRAHAPGMTWFLN